MFPKPNAITLLIGLIIMVIPAAVSCSSSAAPEELPDLTVNSVAVTLEDPKCYDGSPMGLRIHVSNRGLGDAALFVVKANDTSVDVEGLAAGESTSVWVASYSLEPDVSVDATNLVDESDEENNTFKGMIPIPTLPAPCP